MAEVDRRVESYLAHLPEVRAEVRKLAEDRMARMVAVAATHNDSGEFASSFRIVQGATDALIVSNDPNALSKNYGHTAANGRFVEGVHAFEAGHLMTPVLPDVDELVRLAYTAAFPDVTVVTLWPGDWAERMPLLVARKVPGSGAVDPRGLDRSTMSVTACATARGEASLLARQARTALFDACVAQFGDAAAGGYLSHFDELTSPFLQRAGDLALSHSGVYRFEATYTVTTRPHL